MAADNELYRETLYWRELLARVAEELESKAGGESDPTGNAGSARGRCGFGSACTRGCQPTSRPGCLALVLLRLVDGAVDRKSSASRVQSTSWPDTYRIDAIEGGRVGCTAITDRGGAQPLLEDADATSIFLGAIGRTWLHSPGRPLRSRNLRSG